MALLFCFLGFFTLNGLELTRNLKKMTAQDKFSVFPVGLRDIFCDRFLSC